jgi:hypothetical protein
MKSNGLAVMAAVLTLAAPVFAAPVFAAPTFTPNALESRLPPRDKPKPEDLDQDTDTQPDGYLNRSEMRSSMEP